MAVIAVDRARARRKAWRRLVTAGRAPVVRVSVFWLAALLMVGALIGAVCGVLVFSAVVETLYSCTRVM